MIAADCLPPRMRSSAPGQRPVTVRLVESLCSRGQSIPNRATVSPASRVNSKGPSGSFSAGRDMAGRWLSHPRAIIEYMFDTALPDGEALKSAGDAMVVAAIAGWARVEAAASARRLAAVAELVGRRVEGGSAERGQWSCDNWDAMAAEVGAAQGISHGMASGQMYLSVALRDRLPRVGALFAEGTISARLASTIVWRTDLIKDPEVLRLVDKMLAEDAVRFGPLSVNKTAQAIDAVVDRYDPMALRHTRAIARSRVAVMSSSTPPMTRRALRRCGVGCMPPMLPCWIAG